MKRFVNNVLREDNKIQKSLRAQTKPLANAFGELKRYWQQLQKDYKTILKDFGESEYLKQKARSWLEDRVFDFSLVPGIYGVEDNIILDWCDWSIKTLGQHYTESSTDDIGISSMNAHNLSMTLEGLKDNTLEVKEMLLLLASIDETVYDEIFEFDGYPFDRNFDEETGFIKFVELALSYTKKFLRNDADSHIIGDADTEMIHKLQKSMDDIKNGVKAKYNNKKYSPMARPRFGKEYTSIVVESRIENRRNGCHKLTK